MSEPRPTPTRARPALPAGVLAAYTLLIDAGRRRRERLARREAFPLPVPGARTGADR